MSVCPDQKVLWALLTGKDNIDHEKPHDEAMRLLQDAGIYVLAVCFTQTRLWLRINDEDIVCGNPSMEHQSQKAERFIYIEDPISLFPHSRRTCSLF